MWRTGTALAFAAILAAAAHGEVSFPTADAEGVLSGVVTFHNVSEPYFFIEDDSGAAWRIECDEAKSCSFAKRGARVAARGVFPKWATTPRLNKARVEVTGQGEVPEYIEMTPAEMHAVDPDGEPARRHWFGRLVSVSGNVIDINRRETYTQVLIGPKSDLVQVVVPCRLDDPLPASLEIGARIRARGVGVYSSARDPHTNLAMPVTDIMVRLDGPGGLKVIQGSPFWTPLRLWLLIGGTLLLAGVLVFWVKSREKAKADAVQRERLRLSRDLHGALKVRLFRDANPGDAKPLGPVAVEELALSARDSLKVSAAPNGGWAAIVEAGQEDRLARFAAEGPRALADRLLMYWKSHATDVFVRNESVERVGGARAPEPTVMFAGCRSHVTPFRRPRVEDLPLRAEDDRGLFLEPVDGGERTWAAYGKTGCMITSINREIVTLARDAARRWKDGGGEEYARLALEVLDTYLAGIYYRNVPTDLGRGHLQTLFGMQSMETIHDDVIHEATELYALMKPYAERVRPGRVAIYRAALAKWADVQIANGVADNNWDMMQLNYILDIALVLDEPDRSRYIDVCFNQSSVRNLSIRDLAARGFDKSAGTWWECPGYSVQVTLRDFARFADRSRAELGIDLVKEIPVLQTAFDAASEYLFPDGMLIGFGDTHPAPVPEEVRRYAKNPHVSPFFHAPNASWLLARSGMDPADDVAFALNASLGNHQHANGISLELYARGYRLAPDAGVGWQLYSGDDYKEYYSQFPAHNTVMVNSRSTYQTMKSYHPFELVGHGDDWATVRFREPATNAEQERTVRYVKDADGAYFVDVFRSRVAGEREQETGNRELGRGNGEEGTGEWHDYYYHNFGDSLELNGEIEPTEMIAFQESGHYCLSYIQEKFARKGRGDLVATFDWKRPEGNVRTRLFMNDAEGRTFVKALAPATEGLSRVKKPDYGITRDSRTTVLVVRQRGEAWSRPFAAVIDPYGTVESVEFRPDEIRVRRTHGATDVFALPSFATRQNLTN